MYLVTSLTFKPQRTYANFAVKGFKETSLVMVESESSRVV